MNELKKVGDHTAREGWTMSLHLFRFYSHDSIKYRWKDLKHPLIEQGQDFALFV